VGQTHVCYPTTHVFCVLCYPKSRSEPLQGAPRDFGSFFFLSVHTVQPMFNSSLDPLPPSKRGEASRPKMSERDGRAGRDRASSTAGAGAGPGQSPEPPILFGTFTKLRLSGRNGYSSPGTASLRWRRVRRLIKATRPPIRPGRGSRYQHLAILSRSWACLSGGILLHHPPRKVARSIGWSGPFRCRATSSASDAMNCAGRVLGGDIGRCGPSAFAVRTPSPLRGNLHPR